MQTEAMELRPQRDATAAEAAAGLRKHMAYLSRRVGTTKRYLILGILALVLLIVFYGGGHGWFPDRWTPVGIIAVATFGAIFISRRIYLGAYGEIYKRHQTRDQVFRLTDHGLAWSAPGLTGTIAWSSMSDIVDDGDRLMLFITPAQAITLTKAAYDRAALRTFSDELMQRWRKSRAESVP